MPDGVVLSGEQVAHINDWIIIIIISATVDAAGSVCPLLGLPRLVLTATQEAGPLSSHIPGEGATSCRGPTCALRLAALLACCPPGLRRLHSSRF